MTAATFTAADCAEQAGTAIAENCIAGMRDLDDQTDRANLLAAALIGLSTLAHPEHAAAGFARALVTTFEDRNPERESQIDNEAMQDDLDRYFSGLMLHQKQIRYARNEEACPICGGDTVVLHVGSDH